MRGFRLNDSNKKNNTGLDIKEMTLKRSKFRNNVLQFIVDKREQ